MRRKSRFNSVLLRCHVCHVRLGLGSCARCKDRLTSDDGPDLPNAVLQITALLRRSLDPEAGPLQDWFQGINRPTGLPVACPECGARIFWRWRSGGNVTVKWSCSGCKRTDDVRPVDSDLPSES